MGMYDYLGGEQIKIFYRPIFSEKDYETDRPNTWHSGGLLRNFDMGDNLPLQTLYYKYPQNFIVFDYWWDCGDVWVIKDGGFVEFKNYEELNHEDLGEAVFNHHSSELNIKTVEDFKLLKGEYINSKEKTDKKENELFPDGVINTIIHHKEVYEKHKEEWEPFQKRIWDTFNNKWYLTDKYEQEKQFGEFLECLQYLNSRKDKEKIWDDPMKNYLLCKKEIIKMIQENNDLVKNYFDWISDKELIQKAIDIMKKVEIETF